MNTAEYVGSVQNGEHDIQIVFDYHVSNDGIGPYEFWGEQCYDKGEDFIEIDEVTEAYIIHYGFSKTKEEIPLCAVEITSHNNWKTKEFDGYSWTHYRKIDVDSSWVEQVVTQASEDYEWQNEYLCEPEPDYDNDDY